jgi:hypothetical protein
VSETRQEIDPRLVVDVTPALIFSARPDGYLDYFNRTRIEDLAPAAPFSTAARTRHRRWSSRVDPRRSAASLTPSIAGIRRLKTPR